jgi:hypothetical protein
MDAFSEQLDFAALLATLQRWLGCDLCVMVHRPNTDFNIGFCSRLERVRSSQGTGDPTILDFEGARELSLAAVDASARLHTVSGPSGTVEWIEISLAFGMVTTIERLS